MKRLLKWIFRVVLVLLVLAFVFVFVAYWRSTNECDRKNAAAPTNPMKAIVHCDYGVANLKLEEIEKPTPADDQILVRVRAASVNPYDWHFVEGTPKIIRLMGIGLRKPKEIRLGVDFAGTVETVGKNVTQFKPGDEVFGGREGAFAEYVCRRAVGSVASKPASITFEQAASLNIAGITALQAVRDVVVLLEMVAQREEQERALVRRQLHRRRQPALHDAERRFHQECRTLRCDSRQRAKPFSVRSQARLNSEREIRLDRRRRSQRTGIYRAFRPHY